MSRSKLGKHFQCLQVKSCGFFYVSLLSLDVSQVVQRVSMGGTEAEGRVVAFLGLLDKSLFFESICQVAVGIGEVWLELNCSLVSVYCQIYQALFIVDTG